MSGTMEKGRVWGSAFALLLAGCPSTAPSQDDLTALADRVRVLEENAFVPGPPGPEGPEGPPGPAQIVYNDRTVALNGFFCGASQPVLGAFGGYVAGKEICEAVCASASAHMCDHGGLVRSLEVGAALASEDMWYSAPWTPFDTTEATDCHGWTDDQGGGHVWSADGYPTAQSCMFTHPIACCDNPEAVEPMTATTTLTGTTP